MAPVNRRLPMRHSLLLDQKKKTSEFSLWPWVEKGHSDLCQHDIFYSCLLRVNTAGAANHSARREPREKLINPSIREWLSPPLALFNATAYKSSLSLPSFLSSNSQRANLHFPLFSHMVTRQDPEHACSDVQGSLSKVHPPTSYSSLLIPMNEPVCFSWTLREKSVTFSLLIHTPSSSCREL